MEFGRKNKLLKAYGKGLAERMYSEAKEHVIENKNPVAMKYGATFRGTLDAKLKLYLDQPTGLLNDLKNTDRYLVMEGLAEGFLEKGLVVDAYDLYSVSNPKKAKLIHNLLKFDL